MVVNFAHPFCSHAGQVQLDRERLNSIQDFTFDPSLMPLLIPILMAVLTPVGPACLRHSMLQCRAVFEATEPQTRGFVGRPFVSLLFATATGLGMSYVASFRHLREFTVMVVILSFIGVVGYVWERLDTRTD